MKRVSVLALSLLVATGCMSTSRSFLFDTRDEKVDGMIFFTEFVEATDKEVSLVLAGTMGADSLRRAEVPSKARAFRLRVLTDIGRKRVEVERLRVSLRAGQGESRTLVVVGTNTENGLLLLLTDQTVLQEDMILQLQLAFSVDGKNYAHIMTGKTRQYVKREFAPPIPNYGFSRGMR